MVQNAFLKEQTVIGVSLNLTWLLPNRDDINQAITYALSYKHNKVVILCYAEDNQSSRWKWLGKVGEQVDVWLYRLNLNSNVIETEEENFIQDIANILSNAVNGP
jgi:hypothetical protein